MGYNKDIDWNPAVTKALTLNAWESDLLHLVLWMDTEFLERKKKRFFLPKKKAHRFDTKLLKWTNVRRNRVIRIVGQYSETSNVCALIFLSLNNSGSNLGRKMKILKKWRHVKRFIWKKINEGANIFVLEFTALHIQSHDSVTRTEKKELFFNAWLFNSVSIWFLIAKWHTLWWAKRNMPHKTVSIANRSRLKHVKGKVAKKIIKETSDFQLQKLNRLFYWNNHYIKS